MNYTDCAGRFFEIREESAAVPGRCSSGGRALSSDRSGDRRCFPAKRSENQTSRMYSFIRDRSLPVNVSLPDVPAVTAETAPNAIGRADFNAFLLRNLRSF